MSNLKFKKKLYNYYETLLGKLPNEVKKNILESLLKDPRNSYYIYKNIVEHHSHSWEKYIDNLYDIISDFKEEVYNIESRCELSRQGKPIAKELGIMLRSLTIAKHISTKDYDSALLAFSVSDTHKKQLIKVLEEELKNYSQLLN